MPNDPVSAWESWMVIVREQGRQHPGEAAFFRIWGHTVSTRAIGWQGLHELVQRAVRAAELTEGHYAFSSLRWGLIRTAFRADEPIHLVAQQAGLRSLNRIGVHHRREHIIRRSVAGQLGL